jgi:uncharacterized protein YijF (DUF1287 family)
MSARRAAIALAFFLAAAAAQATPIDDLISAARAQVGQTRFYNGSYAQLAYPNGDVPIASGVCSDVVIRAFRHVGLDLQKLVHEDMQRSFAVYPHNWGLSRPDTNIDHRRVPNLATFFKRQGKAVTGAWQPGDIVVFRLPGNLPHIGIVSNRRTSGGRLLVIHNIGAGAQEEDVLDAYAVTGHFRWFR